MNWDRIEGNWHQFRGRAKQRWARLTENDLDRIQGRREELEGFLQEAYGLAVDDVKRQVDKFCKDVDDNGVKV